MNYSCSLLDTQQLDATEKELVSSCLDGPLFPNKWDLKVLEQNPDYGDEAEILISVFSQYSGCPTKSLVCLPAWFVDFSGWL